MENILDIKEILNHLNSKEKKAARKYFTLHYRNTKELQLLKIIENIHLESPFGIENKIRRMGYESLHSKSFLKLKSRLKEKLLDFLSSSFSINEFKKIDDNTYLKHKQKKMLLQSGIMIEKGLLFQAGDLAKNVLRLAKEYDQFDLIVESLNKLIQIARIEGNLSLMSSLSEEARLYEGIQSDFSEIESKFNLLVSQAELQGNLDFVHLCSSFLFQLESKARNYTCYEVIRNFVHVMKKQHQGRFHDAFICNADIIRIMKNHALKFDLRYKILVMRRHIQLLRSTGHSKMASTLKNAFNRKGIPQSYRFLLDLDEFIFNMRVHGDYNNLPNKLTIQNNVQLLLNYGKCLQHFKSKEFKKCLDLIGSKIRAYTLSSTQQLDLMILEMMCHYEAGHDDLLEYKVQSYVKNLAYRSKYEVPIIYHKMHRLIRLLLRFEAGKFSDKLYDLIQEIKEVRVDGLHESRSVFPQFIIDWVQEKVELIDLMKSHELENCNPAFLTRVA